MLEKIGLPSKPSLRGNNWVVDASHCQGCSSQFTFINRKHHCRRCGGLFCGSCTQQRLYLRGQGDAPVRICEPCKKLEEAARFEMRQGHKNRAGKGASKLASGNEDEVLNMINGDGGNESVDLLSSMQQASSSRSSSNIQVTTPNAGEEIVKSLPNMESLTPEELRQRAIDEKKKYKTLKAEGKREEALRAFKRGKDLERQAGALEIEMRKKNRQKTLSSTTDNQIQTTKDKKDDLANELRELGFSDHDLRDADRRPVSMTVEGELSVLMSEVSQTSDSTVKKNRGVDNSEVIALKKRALALKREGKLAEAKEELKRAKILEKQIEEQELLGDAEESDDELYSLIHSMDIDKQDILSTRGDDWNHVDFNHLLRMDDGLDVDGNFDVTDEDMDDPEITAALQSIGWEEDANHPAEIDSVAVPVLNKEALLSEIRSLKREAVNEKRAGNTAEAMALLKKAKLLEADIESSDSQVNDHSSQKTQLADNYSSKQDSDYKAPPKSKLAIQRELLAVKKKALALRREGKIDEAEQELSKGKALEQQLEEIENASKLKGKQVHVSNKHADDILPAAMDIGDEDGEVTDQDMHDPSYLSLLSSVGWKEEDNSEAQSPPKEENVRASMRTATDSSLDKVQSSIQTGRSRKNRGEIQKELLGLKRKSLALRRQGEVEEAEEVLKIAKVLEDQLTEMDAPKEQVTLTPEFEKPNQTGVPSHSFKNAGDEIEIQKSNPIERLEMNTEVTHEKSEGGTASEKGSSANEPKSLQQEILAHKRKAVSLKREGKLAEAKEELRMAKLLEKNLEENNTTPGPSTSSSNVNSTSIDVGKKEQNSVSPPKLSSRDRFKLQQESLGHKRQALKLRREGRTEEAEAEFELAKALESQLEELSTNDSTKPSAEPADDVGIEDLLDPQLLSALREIGIESAIASAISHSPEKPEPVRQVAPKNTENPNRERTQLEEQIKAEKAKAINLKRAGKQAEALDALRRSKLLEKKLNSLVS